MLRTAGDDVLSSVSIQTQSLALRALRLDGNRAKCKRLHWQAANHGCHCFDRASYWLQAAVYSVGNVSDIVRYLYAFLLFCPLCLSCTLCTILYNNNNNNNNNNISDLSK